MELNKLQAMFLLADIEILNACPIDNQYDSDHVRKKLNPWWLVTTPHGLIVIGWRSKVIEIEWSNTGVIYPLIDPEGRDYATFRHPIVDDVTQWATGGHAYGYGNAVSMLTKLKDGIDKNEFLKDYWPANPDKEEEKTEWLITSIRNHWHKSDTEVDRLEVTISTKHKSHALVEFHKTYPNHRVVSTWPKAEVMAARNASNDRHGISSICDKPVPIVQEFIDIDKPV